MKVIFLDVDGVLHPLTGTEMFTEPCMTQLKRIVDETGAWQRQGRWTIGFLPRGPRTSISQTPRPPVHPCARHSGQNQE